LIVISKAKRGRTAMYNRDTSIRWTALGMTREVKINMTKSTRGPLNLWR